jgi:hypothetical protein
VFDIFPVSRFAATFRPACLLAASLTFASPTPSSPTKTPPLPPLPLRLCSFGDLDTQTCSLSGLYNTFYCCLLVDIDLRPRYPSLYWKFCRPPLIPNYTHRTRISPQPQSDRDASQRHHTTSHLSAALETLSPRHIWIISISGISNPLLAFGQCAPGSTRSQQIIWSPASGRRAEESWEIV